MVTSTVDIWASPLGEQDFDFKVRDSEFPQPKFSKRQETQYPGEKKILNSKWNTLRK